MYSIDNKTIIDCFTTIFEFSTKFYLSFDNYGLSIIHYNSHFYLYMFIDKNDFSIYNHIQSYTILVDFSNIIDTLKNKIINNLNISINNNFRISFNHSKLWINLDYFNTNTISVPLYDYPVEATISTTKLNDIINIIGIGDTMIQFDYDSITFQSLKDASTYIINKNNNNPSKNNDKISNLFKKLNISKNHVQTELFINKSLVQNGMPIIYDFKHINLLNIFKTLNNEVNINFGCNYDFRADRFILDNNSDSIIHLMIKNKIL